MRAYISFVNKELIENLRTYRLLIILAVFLLFGLMSPFSAKFTPEILKMANIDPSALGMGNPSAMDSWAQFFKNVGQMGLLVIVIVFCGIMGNEFSKGTLINMLTKGMKRSSVIYSKFTAAIIIWTAAYILCLAVCYAYTAYYFAAEDMNNGFAAFFGMWLYGVLLITLIILGGVLFKNIIGSLLLTGGTAIGLLLINFFPFIQKYNPITLSGDNMLILTASRSMSDFTPAMIVSAVLIIADIAVSVAAFNKKQL